MRFQRAFFTILVVFILLPIAFVSESHAAPINVTVTSTGATLSMHLLFSENMTSLPQISVYLGPTNSTTISDTISRGIQKLEPAARVTSVEFWARTSSASGTTLLQENCTIHISVPNGGSGSFVRSDLSYLSMNVNDSINVAGVELNDVGNAYLLAPLNTAPPSQTRYFIDGTETLSTVIPGLTTKGFALLDFSWVPQVWTWDRQNDVLQQTTKWTLSPPAPRYNLTLGMRSPEGPLRGVVVAVYDPSMDLTVGYNAWAQGKSVMFSLPSPFDSWMPGIIAIPMVAWAASTLLERKFATRASFKKKKR